MATSFAPRHQIFDDLFLKFMENVSDETISFQEYKTKWEESKRVHFQTLSENANVLQEKANTPCLSDNLCVSPSKPAQEEDIATILLDEFVRQYQNNTLDELHSIHKNSVLFRFQSKSMILLFISMAYFKNLIDNFKDKTFDDLIKKLEFFKYQVSRTKQLKLIEVFKGLKSKIEANFPANAFHSLLTSFIRDKVFREGVIELVQEIIVDLILNCNFHHIIQNRNIELKKFILQLRNSKSEEELLTDEMKTLISRCFLLNFHIWYFNVQTGALFKESFTSKPASDNESRGSDVWNNHFLDFLVINGKKNEKNMSYVILRESDYDNFFHLKLTNSHNSQFDVENLNHNARNESSFVNKENFERKFSINTSFVTNEPLNFGHGVKGFLSPKESGKQISISERSGKMLVNGLTLRKMKALALNFDENSKILERIAGI